MLDLSLRFHFRLCQYVFRNKSQLIKPHKSFFSLKSKLKRLLIKDGHEHRLFSNGYTNFSIGTIFAVSIVKIVNVKLQETKEKA